MQQTDTIRQTDTIVVAVCISPAGAWRRFDTVKALLSATPPEAVRHNLHSDVRTAADYAHNYLGMRPKLQPTHMRRVGGRLQVGPQVGGGDD